MTRHMLKWVISCLLVFEFVKPAIQAELGGLSLADLYCNTNATELSPEATAQMQTLYRLAGKPLPSKTEDTPEHCQNCLVTHASPVLTPQFIGLKTRLKQITAHHHISKIEFFYRPTGPPLGGRAPPAFV